MEEILKGLDISNLSEETLKYTKKYIEIILEITKDREDLKIECYTTDYKTCVIDIEKANKEDIVSTEIGKEFYGCFIEENEIISCFVDLEENEKLHKLVKPIIDFIN